MFSSNPEVRPEHSMADNFLLEGQAGWRHPGRIVPEFCRLSESSAQSLGVAVFLGLRIISMTCKHLPCGSIWEINMLQAGLCDAVDHVVIPK